MTDSPVGRLFDSLADQYDQVGVDFFQPIAEHLVRCLDPKPGERALDLGCGRGAALLRLARATGRATGIDLAPRMVAAAAEQAAAEGLGVEVVVGDAQAPGIDGPFDLIASSLVLFFLPDPLAALRAWHQLLVDGGRVGVTTFGPYSDDWRATDEVLLRHRPPEAKDPRAVESPFATDEGVEALLSEAGFASVRTETMVVAVRFDDAEHWYRWSWSQGQRRMWEAIPADERDDVRREAMAAVDRIRRDDGRIGFDQVVRATLGVSR